MKPTRPISFITKAFIGFAPFDDVAHGGLTRCDEAHNQGPRSELDAGAIMASAPQSAGGHFSAVSVPFNCP